PGHRRCAPLPWCADAVRIFLLAADGSPAPERQREEVDEPARPYTLEGTKSDPWVRGGFLFFVGQGDRIGVEILRLTFGIGLDIDHGDEARGNDVLGAVVTRKRRAVERAVARAYTRPRAGHQGGQLRV